MTRTTATTRTPVTLRAPVLESKYTMTTSSSLSLPGNSMSDLSAYTAVMRLVINGATAGGAYLALPYNVNSAGLIKHNNNAAIPGFRINSRINGVDYNYDVAGYRYKLGKECTVALRYTGSVLEFWVDNVLYDSRSASGSLGTTNTTYGINPAIALNGDASYVFARIYNTSLSDTNLSLAMAGVKVPGFIFNIDFQGTPGTTGTPSETILNGTVTVTGTPTGYEAHLSRTQA